MRRRVTAIVAAATVGLASLVGVAAPASAAATGSPVGAFSDVSDRFDGQTVLSGFALDPDAPGQPIDVHLYIGAQQIGTVTTTTAPGVAGPISWTFDTSFIDPMILSRNPPDPTICAYGINVGPGGNALLGCRPKLAPGGASPDN